MDDLDLVNLPPWAQTVLTVAGLLTLVLPALGRSKTLAARFPRLSAALVDIGTDLGAALGRIRR